MCYYFHFGIAHACPHKVKLHQKHMSHEILETMFPELKVIFKKCDNCHKVSEEHVHHDLTKCINCHTNKRVVANKDVIDCLKESLLCVLLKKVEPKTMMVGIHHLMNK